MKIIAEISNPHYHPSNNLKVSKKRNLSIPPNWVANERIIKNGISYAIVMPKRKKELFEKRQRVHLHLPQYMILKLNGKKIKTKIKVHNNQFEPKVHFDMVDGKHYKIVSGKTKLEL